VKQPRASSREFWIAIGVSAMLHVLVGSVFLVTWEHMPTDNMETEVEWTWSAPTASKEQTVASGSRTATPLASSNNGPGEGKTPTTTETDPSKGAALTEKSPGTADGTTTKANPAQTAAMPKSSAPGVGQAGGPAALPTFPSDGAAPGIEGSGTGESSGYALVPPRLRAHSATMLPAEAARAGLSGNVLLLIEVLENGRVGKIVVSRSSGSQILDEAARESVSRWRFDPAWEPQGKKPVRVMTSVWVRYAKEGG